MLKSNKKIESFFCVLPCSKRKTVDSNDGNATKTATNTHGKCLHESLPEEKKLCTSNHKLRTPIQEVPTLNWRKITSENLNLEYVKLFSAYEADGILKRLENEVVYFTGDLLKVQVFGKWHQIPRKQVSFGDPGLSYKFSGNCVPALHWTPIMLKLKEVVERATNQKFNFVLVNRYKDGEDYMGEHQDNEKDLVTHAPIASLSFGQHRDFIFRHRDSRGSKAIRNVQPVKIVLEHGSLLVMNAPTNDFWYHSLPVRKKAPNVRVNLTFRKMKVKS